MPGLWFINHKLTLTGFIESPTTCTWSLITSWEVMVRLIWIAGVMACRILVAASGSFCRALSFTACLKASGSRRKRGHCRCVGSRQYGYAVMALTTAASELDIISVTGAYSPSSCVRACAAKETMSFGASHSGRQMCFSVPMKSSMRLLMGVAETMAIPSFRANSMAMDVSVLQF